MTLEYKLDDTESRIFSWCAIRVTVEGLTFPLDWREGLTGRLAARFGLPLPSVIESGDRGAPGDPVLRLPSYHSSRTIQMER